MNLLASALLGPLVLPLVAVPNPTGPALLPMPQEIEWKGEAIPVGQLRGYPAQPVVTPPPCAGSSATGKGACP